MKKLLCVGIGAFALGAVTGVAGKTIADKKKAAKDLASEEVK